MAKIIDKRKEMREEATSVLVASAINEREVAVLSNFSLVLILGMYPNRATLGSTF